MYLSHAFHAKNTNIYSLWHSEKTVPLETGVKFSNVYCLPMATWWPTSKGVTGLPPYPVTRISGHSNPVLHLSCSLCIPQMWSSQNYESWKYQVHTVVQRPPLPHYCLEYSGISIYRFSRGRRKQTMNVDKRSIRKTITQRKYVVRSSSKVS